MAQPLVSVIIAAYNAAGFITDALGSIQSQQHEPLEIIVVDDGSTDATAVTVASFSDTVRYTYQPNAGPPAARNRGLEIAQGEVVCFLDADDMWTADKLRVQLSLLAAEPELDIVLGHSRYVRATEGEGGNKTLEFHPDSWPILSLGAAAIRARAFERIGRFDEQMRYDDDVDWYLRAREAGLAFRIHPEVVKLYRRHSGNATNHRDMDQHFFLKALKQSLDRRRSEAGAARPLPKWFTQEAVVSADPPLQRPHPR